ncbi:hypothetical protein SeMB42_g06130 [Synchytrium endobioticum]|uniref:Chloride channel protein n=1 Tax=Synchytrium endobioticum TaxID=286115 RepID=A0A507CLC3_9FUNG|nr:hypothetical protein SeLEV6574_g07541 [Synchytrium endobioticum]TPX40153.1 hypothetical protein SeMB42_g06130 [Synchytrium endobioticum]
MSLLPTDADRDHISVNPLPRTSTDELLERHSARYQSPAPRPTDAAENMLDTIGGALRGWLSSHERTASVSNKEGYSEQSGFNSSTTNLVAAGWTSPSPSQEALGGNASDQDNDDLHAERKEEEADQAPLYEDFTTIDWVRDMMREHRRRTRLLANHKPGIPIQFIKLLDASQGWILVTLVGICIGVVAALIDVVAAWLSDIRMGYCQNEWYVSKKICCMGSHSGDGSCDDWVDWSYGMSKIPHITFINIVMYTFFSSLFATACAYLVIKFAPYAAGSGSVEIKTILGGFIIKGFLGIRTLIIKGVGLPLTVASGLAVGKEGPMIHVACCIGNIFPRLFSAYDRNEARKREILSAASSAGVAVAFGAPIGGVLFSMEELSTYFPARTMLQSFYCALVASVTLSMIDPYRGKRVMYEVKYTRPWHFFELFPFLLLGVFGGLSGAFFIRMNLVMQALRKPAYSWSKRHPVLEVAVASVVTAIFCYFNIFTRIDSNELLEALFRECEGPVGDDGAGVCDKGATGYTIFLLLLALLMRVSLTIVSFGLKVPAGIFIPSMVWGALFGRVLGIGVQTLQKNASSWAIFASCNADVPCVTPGTYAILGAMAALCGVTRLTISLTVIMFELTGTLTYILPCMMVLMTAKLAGDAFEHGGLADIMIRINRFPFLDPREEGMHSHNHSPSHSPLTLDGLSASTSDAGDSPKSAKSVMTPVDELVCLYKVGYTIATIERLLNDSDYQGFPVLHAAQDRRIIGYITRGDLRHNLERAKARQGIPINGATAIYFGDVEFNEFISPMVLPSLAGPQKRSRSGSARPAVASADGGSIVLEFGQYVDKTPLTVQPRVAFEFVMDLFKKLGPRYVLVVEKGWLAGLITKKDLLQALYGEDVFALPDIYSIFGPIQLPSSGSRESRMFRRMAARRIRNARLNQESEFELHILPPTVVTSAAASPTV